MEKITYKEIKNFTAVAENSSDEERVYDISANVNIQQQTNISSIDNGQVKNSEGMIYATFNSWGNVSSNLNIQYQNATEEERSAILTAVNDFISNLEDKVAKDAGEPGTISTEEEIDDMQLKLSRMIINSVDMTVEEALEMIDLFPHWEDCIGKQLAAGFKLQYGGMLYETLDKVTPTEDKAPGKETEDIYKLLTTEA